MQYIAHQSILKKLRIQTEVYYTTSASRSPENQLYSEELNKTLVLSNQYSVDSKTAKQTTKPTWAMKTTKKVSEGKLFILDLKGKDRLY